MAETSRIAIVTGGSRGIGRETVVRLARDGVPTILTYNSSPDEAAKTEILAEQAGAAACAIHLDVGNPDSFDGFATKVRSVLRDWGVDRFDYLVNNAGTSSASSLETITVAEMDNLYAVHLRGPMLLTQCLLPLIRDGGRIINISSGLARFAMPGRIGYGPIKAAVEALSRNMALELASRRITVNVVAPGPTATDFSGGVVRDNPDVNKAVAASTALGRAGMAEDIAPVIAKMLSDDFGWVNGQRLEVAGGVHL